MNIFPVETSFHQFSNMTSSGLKKMFILQFYMHKRYIRKKRFPITFFTFSLMVDVMPCVRLMLCLGWCYCQFYDGRCYIIWADVITHVLSFGRCYCLFQWCSSLYDTTFHVSLILADVIAKWQDGTATFILQDGRCYFHVSDVMATVYLFCDGRCYSQVADGITTQSGWWYLADVITKLADRIAMGSVLW